MTAQRNQNGQGNAGAPDMEAMLVKLSEVGQGPTPGEVKRAGLKAKVIAAMRQHGTLSAASLAAGVARSTIYAWRDSDPAFAAEVHQWMHEGMEEELVESLYRIATSSDPKMATAAVKANEILLKSVNPDKYSDRLKVDATTTVNHQVSVIHDVRDQLRERQAARLQQLRGGVVDVQALPTTEQGGGGM